MHCARQRMVLNQPTDGVNPCFSAVLLPGRNEFYSGSIH
jgi:hypothetical protein